MLSAILGALLGAWAGAAFGGALAGHLAPLVARGLSAPSAITLTGYPKDRELASLWIIGIAGLLAAFASRLALRGRTRIERLEPMLLAGVWIVAGLFALQLTLP